MRLIEFRKVVLSQDEPIRSIFKLVEAIKHCSRVFQITAEMTSNANLRQLAEDTHRELEQYVFELQTEIRRLGNEESVPGPVAGDNSGTDTNFLEFRNWCLSPNYPQRALQRVLDCFDEVFKTPTHRSCSSHAETPVWGSNASQRADQPRRLSSV